MKISQKLLLVAGFGVIMTACDTKDKPKANNIDSLAFNKNAKKDTTGLNEGIKSVADAFPSPVDFVSHINQAKIAYDEKWLNPPANVSNYLTVSQKTALNLGAYMADLGYVALYSKNQASLDYLKVVKKLSDQLNILSDDMKTLVTRFEQNINVRDSLLSITREGYGTVDEYLRGKSNRKDLASLILAGSWVEGLYATNTALLSSPDIEKNEAMKTILWRIGAQKRSLTNLIGILEKQEDNETTKTLLVKLKELQKIYEKVNVTDAKPEETTILDLAEIQSIEEITNKVILSQISKVDITFDTFKEIAKKTAEIRTFMVEK